MHHRIAALLNIINSVVSVDGVLGQEEESFIELLAEKIAIKWKKNHIQK